MKTLDEVIDALEICGHDESPKCPYFDTVHWCCCEDHMRSIYPLKKDALHYLKEYRDLKATMDWHEEMERIRYRLMNPPLTWDELKQMEGKPVWVEQCNGDTKGWLLILRTNYDVITCTTKHGNSFYLYKSSYGEKWQAYRKERG